MYAKTAAAYIHAYCRDTWPGDGPAVGTRMASTMTTGSLIDVFDHVGYGTHKYIPADKLTADLERPKGAGVYGFWEMGDGSYLLLTCDGPLAYWSGKLEDEAKWAK